MAHRRKPRRRKELLIFLSLSLVQLELFQGRSVLTLTLAQLLSSHQLVEAYGTQDSLSDMSRPLRVPRTSICSYSRTVRQARLFASRELYQCSCGPIIVVFAVAVRRYGSHQSSAISCSRPLCLPIFSVFVCRGVGWYRDCWDSVAAKLGEMSTSSF